MSSKENETKLFLPVPKLTVDDLLNWQNAEQRKYRHLVHRVSKSNADPELVVTLDAMSSRANHHKKCFGQKVDLNDEAIALFRIGREVYATQAKCPHAGGPLYLADIEELVPGQVCLKCPWHKWTFDIDTGRSVMPPGRNLQAKTFPVKVSPCGHLKIGFDSFGPSAFQEDF